MASGGAAKSASFNIRCTREPKRGSCAGGADAWDAFDLDAIGQAGRRFKTFSSHEEDKVGDVSVKPTLLPQIDLKFI